MKTITFTINGKKETKQISDNSMTLLKFLREVLYLTGTKEGCGEGECGACTVIVNGKAVNSCLMLAVEADGADIITVEGLPKDGELDPLQKKFIEHNAIQCGFCTPGMLMSAKALLMKNPEASDEDIKEAIAGNLCRCTGYKQIIEAIRDSINVNV
ncbi:MAG: (2Fe-2S)-binding protein [Armatimonadota bacterium]